jgi:two-component system phosphate regulon response regulator PhoB
MHKGTVLVIDDEKDLIELVRYNLEKEGFDVVAATDGRSGLDIATRHRPELIVLDVMMPGIDGLEVCRQLRGAEPTRQIPVIMLTARVSEADRIVGLELGADDYVTKPFSPRELVARVKAVLRRSAPNHNREEEKILRHGDLAIDPARHEVTAEGKPVSLTATEFRILQYMASRPGRVLSRDEIIDAALGRGAVVLDRTIDVHITAIRRKLGRAGEMIETVRGFGYKLRDRVGAEVQ